MQVFFERHEEIAPTIWQYYFRPERPLDYTAGQYVDLHISSVVGDPRGPSRTFTLTSLPGDELLSFAAKFDDHLSKYKQALQSMQPGNAARIDDAMGDVVLPKLASMPLVFVAGGLGIASFVSMTKTLIQSNEQRDITVLYARRTNDQKLFIDVLQNYSFTNAVDFVAPVRLSVTDILNHANKDSLIYLSGSQNFVESLRNQLREHGVENSHIIFDFFDGYTEL